MKCKCRKWTKIQINTFIYDFDPLFQVFNDNKCHIMTYLLCFSPFTTFVIYELIFPENTDFKTKTTPRGGETNS